MVERMPDMPAGTIGFRVSGEVEREDYEQVLIPVQHRQRRAAGHGGARPDPHPGRVVDQKGGALLDGPLDLDAPRRQHLAQCAARGAGNETLETLEEGQHGRVVAHRGF